MTMDLEQAKMAILVGGCWFDGVDVDEKTFTLSYPYVDSTSTYQVTVEISESKIYMD